MNEKTDKLREIFQSVTDEKTVTEAQEETRGSLAGKDELTVEQRVTDVIHQMDKRYDFVTDFSTAELVEIAKYYFDDLTDDDIATEVGTESSTVFEARMDLHLFDSDDSTGVELAAFRREENDDTLMEEYGIGEDEVRRFRRVAATEEQSRTANDRYRDEFDNILGDAELSAQLASEVREDGLEDATEGMETDVSL